MALRNTPTRYGSIAVSLHWLTVLLVACAFLFIELKGEFPKGSYWRAALASWHMQAGVTVLLLTLLRLIWRALNPRTPAIMPTPSKAVTGLSHLAHFVLYLVLLALPILGFCMQGAAGKMVPWLGLSIPPLLSTQPELAQMLKNWHETLGTLFYWLIGLHALAAIWHHWGVRDNTLLRMIPEHGGRRHQTQSK